MSNTEATWTQDLPFPDGIFFEAAINFVSPTVNNTGISSPGAGLVLTTAPAAATTNYFNNLDQLIRTGVFGSAFPGFQQFGTKGPPPVAGPSTVAGTSGPRGIKVIPPILKAQLPTLPTGQFSGPVPKGMQINSVDVIYTVLGVAATSISFGLTQTLFGAAGAGATAPVVTNIIAFGTNGLPTAVAANPVTTNIVVPTPVMLTASPNGLISQIQFVLPTGSTVSFYGANYHISYNYN